LLTRFVKHPTETLTITRTELAELKECVTDFPENLKGPWFYLVSKLKYVELSKTLHKIKKRYEALQALFDTVDNKANCKLDKICYEEDILAAQSTFLTMWENVESLKTACTSKI